jgi:hypothetical protein
MNTKGLQKIGGFFAKNSPTLLTGIGVAGLISTVVMAIRATPRAIQILEEEKNRRSLEADTPDPITKKDAIVLTWKCYIPTAVLGAATIGCIVSANSINLRRNAVLAGLYSLSETAIKEYKAKVVETIGESKAHTIKDEIAKDRVAKNPVNDKEVIITGKGDTLCYEPLSGRYFKSDIEKIRKIINEANRRMMNEQWVTVNEVYYELGLEHTDMGEMLGWHVDDGLLEPDFSSQIAKDDTPCIVVNFNNEPRFMYQD